MKNTMTHTARAPYVAALAAVQAGYTEESLNVTRSSIGGSRVISLARYVHEYANGACVVCRQHTTTDTHASVLTSATVAVLIPCAMVADSNMRSGYVAGNVANMCRNCVNMANANESASGELHVWTADTLDAELVPLTWPKLAKVRPILSEIESAHAKESRRVWAARGIV